jgi:phage-related protein
MKRKAIAFEGSSLDDLRNWPEASRQAAGYQLDRVQQGLEPDDWKPFKTVGQGVREIRIAEDNGQWRILYVQIISNTVHVLHCFRKKTRKTAQADIDIARQRFKIIRSK